MRPPPCQDQPGLRTRDLCVADGGPRDAPRQEALPHHRDARRHQEQDPAHPGRSRGRQVADSLDEQEFSFSMTL